MAKMAKMAKVGKMAKTAKMAKNGQKWRFYYFLGFFWKIEHKLTFLVVVTTYLTIIS